MLMECFGDDILALILKRIDDRKDRESFSLVCKQWFRVERLNRVSLRVLEPDLLRGFLPRLPNLVSFQSTKEITNSDMEFVARTCPKIQVLNLNFKERRCSLDEFDEKRCLKDVDDSGLCAFATGCGELVRVFLRRRRQIGDLGIASLVGLARNLEYLDLGRCIGVTDESLQAIGSANSLRVLNLEGCFLITDRGLASLASGCLSKTLKKLVIAECDRITDDGLLHLENLCCLEELNLGDCGPKVTDIGGMAIATIQTLRRLNFSWLINISDHTIIVLAQTCYNLEALDLTGCESTTGDGIRVFAGHRRLEELVLTGCEDISGEVMEELVLGCPNLKYIVLDRRLRKWVPETIRRQRFCCLNWV
ncbi:F-box/LRR-repeat protein 4-like [Diospyros lotus]|uniref:F-box/LRR-repeat protein 4-like n=1 Tax=Diospyros lotus TaxID=55363 RepID=UPI00225109B9|nr:F-box/LRR-repeat protein 4-like [Diospyros lotus]